MPDDGPSVPREDIPSGGYEQIGDINWPPEAREDIPEELEATRRYWAAIAEANSKAAEVIATLGAERDEARAQSEALAEAIERARERLSKYDFKGPKQVTRAEMGLEEALRAFRSSRESSDAT